MAEATLITIDDDGEEFLQDHLTHFFNTISYDNINCFSQEDKARYFKLVTDHEILITKLYEESVLNSITFLPVALRNNVDNELIREYKIWLEKQ